MFPLIKLGSLEIPTYILWALLGFVVAILVFGSVAKLFHIERSDAIYSSMYCIIGVLIGSKILYFITKFPSVVAKHELFFEYPLESLTYLFSGNVFYGGLIGGALGVVIYCKRYHLSVLPFANAAAPAIPLMHAFGRVGCFFAGCCYGVEYDGPLSVVFPMNEFTVTMGGVNRLPIQLIEGGFNVLLFLGLLCYVTRRPKQGSALGIYIISYGVARFVLEYFRGDLIRGGLLGISTSQWVSVLLLPLGVWLIRLKRVEERQDLI